MPRLTRQHIVETALQLLDQVGLAGLTTRRLAEALGVKSPALYWHFRDMRALLDAMAETMLSPGDWPGPDTGTPPDIWLAQRAHAFRRALLAFRDGALVHAGTRPSREAAPSVESQLQALVAYGLRPKDALRLQLAVSRYTVGWVLEEQAEAERDGAPDVSLGDGRTPVLTAAQRDRDADAEFDYGLRALIAGGLRERT